MPTFKLSIKADLEGIKELIPQENNLWKFNIASIDGGDTRNGVTISTADILPLDGSKGDANFIVKWTKSSPQSYAKIVPLKNVNGKYSKSGEWTTILAIECRGLELIEWIPETDFHVETEGGFTFYGIDLREKDWAEYDEDNDLSVTIMNLEYKIERV